MPKGLKLRRIFPYSEFGSWLNSDSKLTFDNYMNIHACHATLEMQNTNKNSVMEDGKMIHSKEIFSEEKSGGFENQILPNRTLLNAEDSAELKMDTNFNLIDASKISLKLDSEEDKLSSTDHKLDYEVQNLCSTASAAASTKHKNLDPFYVVSSSSHSSDSLGKKDLKLDDHEVRTKKVDFKNIFTKSEESVPQDGSAATTSFDSKICDDKYFTLNTVCVSRRDDSGEPLNTTVSTMDKILSEAIAHKESSSIIGNICENKVKESVNGMSSMNTANQKSATKTACILHNLCKNQEDEACADLLINAASTSQKEMQSVGSDVLEKSEASDGKELKLDVILVGAEKLNFEGLFAKSKDVPLDESPVTNSFDPKGCDYKCLNLNTACANELGVFEEPFNTTASTSNTILSEAISDKYPSSKADNMCEKKAETSANLDCEEDEVHKYLLINAASSSQNEIQSDDFYVLETIESLSEGDLEIDVHKACAEKENLQGTLEKYGESPQDESPVTCSSFDAQICDDKYLNLNTAGAINKDEKPFSATASIKEEIFSDSNDEKAVCPKTGTTSEIQVEKSVSGITSISTANSNFNSSSETNAETQKSLDGSSNSQNKIQLFDFYELEKSDIEDPEWETVRKLKSNEERYKQVRECWNTKNIPNPNKNLTYHSYRKQKLQAGKLDDRLIKQHKRQASEKSAHPPAKRTRYCTYTVDNQIESIKSEQFNRTTIIQNEMKKQVNKLDYNFNYQVSELKKYYNGYQFHYQNSRNQFMRDRNLLGMQYDQNLHDIKNKYYHQIDTYKAQCQSKINSLQKAHDEILTFCNFYEGLREDNPTVLTEAQLQEIEEIDDVYEQLKKYYN